MPPDSSKLVSDKVGAVQYGRSSIDDSRALSWLLVIVPICCQLLRFSPLFVFAYILLEYRVKIGLFWAYSN